jgi:ABC-type lipoprotein release transport system permease subunit
MEARNFASHGEATYSSPESDLVGKIGLCGVIMSSPSYDLNKGEILISTEFVNSLFPDGAPDFPFALNMRKYEFPENEGSLIIDREYTVVGIKDNPIAGFGNYYISSEEDVLELRKVDIVPYAIYVEDFEHADKIIDEMTARYFSWNSTNGTAVTLLNQSVSMFYELFSLFEILLIILIVVFLASYSIRNIRSNYYQIGVIKAIGGRSSDISKIYTAQTTILTIVVCILTYFGALYLVDVANDILIESFTRITKSAIGTINIITFDIKIVLYTMLTAFLLSMLSTVIPLLTLHRIKPVNIIKAKE